TKEHVQPGGLSDIRRKLFPENHTLELMRQKQTLSEGVQEFAQKRIVPSGLDPLIRLLTELQLEQFEYEKSNKAPAENKLIQYGQQLNRILSSLKMESRYLKDKLVTPLERKKGDFEFTEIHRALGQMGVYDALLRDVVREMRKDIQGPDFDSLLTHYDEFAVLSHMAGGIPWSRWLNEEVEDYNRELNSLVQLVQRIGEEQKELFDMHMNIVWNLYRKRAEQESGQSADLEEMIPLKKARAAFDEIRLTAESIRPGIHALDKEVEVLNQFLDLMAQRYHETLQDLQARLSRPLIPSKYIPLKFSPRERSEMRLSGFRTPVEKKEMKIIARKAAHYLQNRNGASVLFARRMLRLARLGPQGI
ncbi:MAG: hypothetical protein ACRENF_06755, partial [Thermodesulfobacteriota bacterium]